MYDVSYPYFPSWCAGNERKYVLKRKRRRQFCHFNETHLKIRIAPAPTRNETKIQTHQPHHQDFKALPVCTKSKCNRNMRRRDEKKRDAIVDPAQRSCTKRGDAACQQRPGHQWGLRVQTVRVHSIFHRSLAGPGVVAAAKRQTRLARQYSILSRIVLQ